MIRDIEITNQQNETLAIELANPEKSGFAILDISGLGPIKADINVLDNGINDGAIYNSARANTRNIVLSLRFIGTDIEKLRQKTYQFFPLKQEIQFVVHADNRTGVIDGYIESNEPTIFSKTEGCKISIICPSPYFRTDANNQRNTVFSGNDAMFEFPFSNESLTAPLIEFGAVRHDTAGNVVYDGDAGVGITITITAIANVSVIHIYNALTRETMTLDTTKIETITGSQFDSGDKIIISTVKNKKSIRLLRDGVYYDIFRCLDLKSDWFTIYKGDNVFSYTADPDVANLQFQIENDVLYEGM